MRRLSRSERAMLASSPPVVNRTPFARSLDARSARMCFRRLQRSSIVISKAPETREMKPSICEAQRRQSQIGPYVDLMDDDAMNRGRTPCAGGCRLVRRVVRRGMWDYMVSLLGLYPWRCDRCRVRFYSRRRLFCAGEARILGKL